VNFSQLTGHFSRKYRSKSGILFGLKGEFLPMCLELKFDRMVIEQGEASGDCAWERTQVN